MRILLQGIVGSTAYGLDTAESDVDRLGVFAHSTDAILGLYPPKDSIVENDPDRTLHEAKKYALLALACNPTVTELLWLSSYLYDTVTPRGADLIAIRSSFLSAKRVRDAYFGYASSQFKRLETRGDGSFSSDTRKRTAKHARHLYRLLLQGYDLYTTGTLSVGLRASASGLVREFGERVAGGDIEHAREKVQLFQELFDDAKTCLPSNPDEDIVENWLWKVRRDN